MATKLRADLSPSRHPQGAYSSEVRAALDVPQTLGAVAESTAVETLGAAYVAAGRLADTIAELARQPYTRGKDGRAKIMVNAAGLMVNPDHVKELARRARSELDRVAPSLDAGIKRLHALRDQLASSVDTALAHPAPHGAEIRAHVKAMPDAFKRDTFVRAAIKAGDLETVAAIIHSPSYLSGCDGALPDGDGTPFMVNLRRAAERQFAPVETAQRDALTKHVIPGVIAACRDFGADVKRVEDAAKPMEGADTALARLGSSEGAK